MEGIILFKEDLWDMVSEWKFQQNPMEPRQTGKSLVLGMCFIMKNSYILRIQLQQENKYKLANQHRVKQAMFVRKNNSIIVKLHVRISEKFLI